MKKIYLSGKHMDKFAMVDDEDYRRLAQHNWYLISGRYAARQESYVDSDGKRKRRHISMHREILNPPKGYVTDHIDGDGLRNTRDNLRAATPSQNVANNTQPIINKHGYRGIRYERKSRTWVATIFSNPVKPLGEYDTKEEAAFAYNLGVFERWGEFGRPNNIPESRFSYAQRKEFFRKQREERHLRRSNTSGYLGVIFEEDRQMWRASIRTKHRSRRLGQFHSAEDAAKAYNAAAIKRYGQEAKLNPVDGTLEEWQKILLEAKKNILRQSNTSGYLGVCYIKNVDRWLAYTDKIAGRHYFGTYETPEEAAYVVDQARMQIYPDQPAFNVIDKETHL